MNEGLGRGSPGALTRGITHLGGATATIVVVAVLVLAGDDTRALGLAVLSANVLASAAVHVIKRVVARPRPCDAAGRPLALIQLPDRFSFPSGHSAAAAASAVTIALAEPWLAPSLLPLAGVVAWSRVALRVHYVTDVLAGIALGSGGALGTAALWGL